MLCHTAEMRDELTTLLLYSRGASLNGSIYCDAHGYPFWWYLWLDQIHEYFKHQSLRHLVKERNHWLKPHYVTYPY